jgi:hypothetical protein
VCGLTVNSSSSSSSEWISSYRYDLYPLRRASNDNFYYVTSEGTLYINPCNVSSSGCAGDAPVCLTHSLGNRALGSIKSASVAASPLCEACGMQLIYANGSKCSSSSNYSVTINTICSDLYLGITNVTQVSDCAYSIELRSPLACPINVARCSDLSIIPPSNTSLSECQMRSDCMTCSSHCAPLGDGCMTCGYSSVNGTVTYDLTNYTLSLTEDLSWSLASGAVYSYVPCGYTTLSCGALPSPMCRRFPNATTSVGDPVKTKWNALASCERCGVVASYIGGATALGNIALNPPATASVSFLCSDYDYGLTSVRELPSNQYQLTIQTPYACPIGRPSCQSTTTSSDCESVTSFFFVHLQFYSRPHHFYYFVCNSVLNVTGV